MTEVIFVVAAAVFGVALGVGLSEFRREEPVVSGRAKVLTALLTFRTRAMSTYSSDVLLAADAWEVLRPYLTEDEADVLALSWRRRKAEEFEGAMVELTRRVLAMDDEGVLR